MVTSTLQLFEAVCLIYLPWGVRPMVELTIYLNRKGFLTPSCLNKSLQGQISRGLQSQKVAKSRLEDFRAGFSFADAEIAISMVIDAEGDLTEIVGQLDPSACKDGLRIEVGRRLAGGFFHFWRGK